MFRKHTKLKVFLALVSIIIISLALGILYAKKQRSEEEKQIISEYYAPTPKIPKEYKGETDKVINFSLDENKISIPKEAPLLDVQYKNISLNDAKDIAKSLDNNLEPRQIDDVFSGKKFLWSTDKYSLIISPQISQISYSLSYYQPPKVENKNFENEKLNNLAQNFLNDIFGIPKDKLKLLNISYLVKNPQTNGYSETTDKSGAILYQLNYTYNTSDYQILTLVPDQPFIYVQILPNGDVYNSQATLLDQAKEGEQKFVLKQYNDIKDSADQAVLVGLSNDYLSIASLNENQIEAITINKITLAYLLENSKSQTLKPVFLLEGPAKVKNSTANYAQLYMPAIKYSKD